MMQKPYVYVERRGAGTLVRLIYFLLIGCWLGTIWLVLSLLFCLTIILLPIGLLMLRAAPKMYFLD